MTKRRFRILVSLLIAQLLVGLGMIYVLSCARSDSAPAFAAVRESPTVSPQRTQTPSSPSAAPTATPSMEPTHALPPTWTPTPTWTPYPTPSPVPPTPTETPIPSPTPTPIKNPLRPTAAPIRVTVTAHPSSTLAIPTRVPRLDIPEEAVTVVLLGSDQRPDWNNWRTDAIQYVVIYPDVPSVSMLSIPRDLYVYIPDFWMTRINFADMYGEAHDYEGGGLGLLNQTLLYNLGITADYYVKVNFDGLIGLVDAVGGIEMPVFCRLEDYWPYPDENGEYPRFVLEPGIHHLNGEQALWYSRSRKTTSVFSRERRQQQVLEAIWRRGKQANLFEAAPSLYDQWHHLFDTDLGVGNILALAVTGSQLSPADVNRFNIGAGQVKSYVTPYGGYVFLPQWEEIEPVLQGVLARPSSSRATRAPVPIDVWNGTGHADWDRLAAERLLHAGFLPNLDCGDGAVRPQTQLYFYGETTKGSGLASVQRIFHIPDTQVIMQKDPNQAVKLRLVLGQEYNPCR